MPGEGGVPENAGHGLCLNHAGKGPLRRRITLGINVGPGRDNGTQGILRRSEVTAIVEVERIERRPELAAQFPAGGEARNVGRRGVFCSTPGGPSPGPLTGAGG